MKITLFATVAGMGGLHIFIAGRRLRIRRTAFCPLVAWGMRALRYGTTWFALIPTVLPSFASANNRQSEFLNICRGLTTDCPQRLERLLERAEP